MSYKRVKYGCVLHPYIIVNPRLEMQTQTAITLSKSQKKSAADYQQSRGNRELILGKINEYAISVQNYRNAGNNIEPGLTKEISNQSEEQARISQSNMLQIMRNTSLNNARLSKLYRMR